MAPKRRYIASNGPTILQMLRATKMLEGKVFDKEQTITKTQTHDRVQYISCTSTIFMKMPTVDASKKNLVFHNPVELVQMVREAPEANYTWFAVDQQWNRTKFAGIGKNIKEELKSYLSRSLPH